MSLVISQILRRFASTPPYYFMKGKKKPTSSGKEKEKEAAAATAFPCISQSKSGLLLLTVSVIPNASVSEVVRVRPEEISVRLSAPPVQGEANREAVHFLAKTLHLKKADLELIRGHRSRQKTLQITGGDLDAETLFARLLLSSSKQQDE